MFWKKKDEFSDIGLGEKDPLGKDLAFGDNFNLGTQPGLGQQSPGMPEQAPAQAYPQQPPFQPQPAQPQFQAQRYESPQQDMAAKNLEVISSKLDALRVSVESVNQRLANLEAIARGEADHRKKRYY
tara:strand:+ start:349 stop:729 length:381 start_codon:yes stop_codon:yes gene_type:complete